MWKKDGKNFDGSIILSGMRVFNPTPEQLTEAGYTDEPLPAATPTPTRYSKLKIIRALGDGWAAKKAELEAAGMYDEFVNAAFLQSDDAVFAAIYADLSTEERALLEECRYED